MALSSVPRRSGPGKRNPTEQKESPSFSQNTLERRVRRRPLPSIGGLFKTVNSRITRRVSEARDGNPTSSADPASAQQTDSIPCTEDSVGCLDYSGICHWHTQ